MEGPFLSLSICFLIELEKSEFGGYGSTLQVNVIYTCLLCIPVSRTGTSAVPHSMNTYVFGGQGLISRVQVRRDEATPGLDV